MTATELIEALRLTGTGEKKLEAAARIAAERSDMHADELARRLGDLPGFSPGTAAKAAALAGGASVGEFLGTPPPNGDEAKNNLLAEKIGAVVGEKVAEAMAAAPRGLRRPASAD